MSLSNLSGQVLDLAAESEKTIGPRASSSAFYLPYSKQVWNAAAKIIRQEGDHGFNKVASEIVLLRERRAGLLETAEAREPVDLDAAKNLIEQVEADKSETVPEKSDAERVSELEDRAAEMMKEDHKGLRQVRRVADLMRNWIQLLTGVLEEARLSGSPPDWDDLHSNEALWEREAFLDYFSGFVKWSERFSSSTEMIRKEGLGGHGTKKRLWEEIIRHIPPEIKARHKESADDKIKVVTVRRSFERTPALGFPPDSEATLFVPREDVEATVVRLFWTAKLWRKVSKI